DAGNAIVVWSRTDDGTGSFVIQTRRFDVATGVWSIPAIDLSDNTQDAVTPQIAMDILGNGIAVWSRIDNGTGKSVIQSRRYDVGTDLWLTTTDLSEPGDPFFPFLPQVAMDPSGNAIVVWQRTDDTTGKSVIQAKKYDEGTDLWLTTTDLSDPAENASLPQIAMNASGDAVAVWSKRNNPIGIFTQAKRYDAETDLWLTTTNLSEPGDFLALLLGAPQVAMDQTGNAIVIWVRADNIGRFLVQTKRYNAGTDSWSTPVINLSDLGAFPQVAMDDAGNGIAVWAGSGGIQANRYNVATDLWSTTATGLSDSGGDPQIAMDAAGNGIAIWSNGAIRTKFYDVTTDLWAMTAIDLSGSGELPQVAMNASGNAVAVWERTDDGTGKSVIQSTFYANIPLPTGSKKIIRFPAQADLVHVIRWNAVSGAVKYRIYLDAYFSNIIAEIPASKNPCFEYHGRCPGEKVTYYIVAVDENGNNGIPSSITI
ncbi:hypothetical protein ACFLYA_01895, partial [Candidatus Dependentiae bacterium]